MAKKNMLKKKNQTNTVSRLKSSDKSNKKSIGPVAQLQKEYGNAGLQNMYQSGALQTKLKMGKPGDRYEREADSVADKVMNMPDQQVARQEQEEEVQSSPLSDQISPLVQRQAEEEDMQQQAEEEEETPQAKLLQKQDDEEDVQQQPEDEEGQAKFIQHQAEEEETAQSLSLQKQEKEDEVQKQSEEEEETGQAKSIGKKSGIVSSNVESSINSIRNGGQPIPESSRNFFEKRFGSDFSRVKVHTGAQANQLAKSINAKALTVGKDIVFGSGYYAPESKSGKHLMAHELTHVVQQNKGSKGNKQSSVNKAVKDKRK